MSTRIIYERPDGDKCEGLCSRCHRDTTYLHLPAGIGPLTIFHNRGYCIDCYPIITDILYADFKTSFIANMTQLGISPYFLDEISCNRNAASEAIARLDRYNDQTD